MLNFLKPSKPMKGYKITDNERTKKYGIGANSLKMLKDKAFSKFPVKDCRIYLSKDGFEVSDEDYFQTIEAQTLFIVAGANDDITTDSDLEYEKLREQTPILQISDFIYEFIEKNPEKFRKMIIDYEKCHKNTKLSNENEKTEYSLKTEHTEWFEGQEERCQTKEEVMAKRSQDRIRTYYYKTKDEITKNKLYRTNMKAHQIFDKVLEQFRYLLIGCDYFSMIFDRSCEKKHQIIENLIENDQLDAGSRIPNKRLRQMIKEYTRSTELLGEWSVSLCTKRGDFYCHGSYSQSSSNKCDKNHLINPYSSRENLILFQVWNLDHQIELSRTILPSLIDNVKNLIENPNEKCPKHKKIFKNVNIIEFFLEIFSLKNLKLVHIVCHEKAQRTNKSNGHLICEDCKEYKILKEFSDISCPEEVDAY